MKEITPCSYGTPEELESFIEQIFFSEDKYCFERIYANYAGWDLDIYKKLLGQYLLSTQVDLTENGKNATEEKGDPFENVVRYFLEKGGFVHNAESLSSHQKWQLDGAGLIHRGNLRRAWGNKDADNIGNFFLLECKNEKKSIESDWFCKYRSRLDQFGCQLGVFASTSGFSLYNGLGIAEDIHSDCRYNKYYHLLLTVEDLYKAFDEDIPPLQILRISLYNARFDKYRIDKELQVRMSRKHCYEITTSYCNSFF